jgi:lipoprotein-anchoring transpeptidase ErfK/SrfK
MNRSQKAGAGLVKSVFSGRGAYHVKYPDAGEHAEVSLSKQVLALIKNGKPFAIYPVSTGKPSTPTITGHYTFYRQEPGYNSEGMYYSFYWHNGYAVHGYAEVPNYAASHGCVRTFIADQPRIYEQLHFGESIFVF